MRSTSSAFSPKGTVDRASARTAVDAQFKRLTPVEVLNIGRAGPSQLTTIQLAQAMQDQNDTSQAGTQRDEQIATIEARSQAVDRALLNLEKFTRS